MKRLAAILLVLPWIAACAPSPGSVTATFLMSRPRTDMPGTEAAMIWGEYGLDGADPAHRHNAHRPSYVLEGPIVMQVMGVEAATLIEGQTLYESPEDVHLVGNNASSTKPATFLVVPTQDEAAPVLIPAA